MLKQDFIELFAQLFISGVLPVGNRGINRFSRLSSLNTWLSKACGLKGINYTDNCNLFWGCSHLFRADGHRPGRSGVLMDHFWFISQHRSARAKVDVTGHTAAALALGKQNT
ncbi:MAG: hypothetical protein ATN33_01625 [Epulopiscium sp. Nele67-Bin001]|nr:MAG: hypothetical protein ATN33_01625 [Epulopiscium sp. Nele67-Bin001]